MPSYVPTPISFSNHGLTKNANSFVIADDAYAELQNAYVWRGRVVRRKGSVLLGRFRRVLTTTALTAAWATTGVPYPLFLNTTPIIQHDPIQPGDEPNASIESGFITPIVITIHEGGNSIVLTENTGTGTFAVTSNTIPGVAITSATLNYVTGNVTLVFTGVIASTSSTASFAYYPSLPAMGLGQREIIQINNEETIGFDQKYAYKFDTTGLGQWIEYPEAVLGTTTWQGSDSQFFYILSYWFSGTDKLLWTTNFNQTGTPDPIRVHTGTGGSWVDFRPPVDGTNFMDNCLLLIPYRGRLVALNTWEGPNMGPSAQFGQRARWCRIGTPLYADSFPMGNPFDANSWSSDAANPGKGGFVDCSTAEQIVSAEFVRDTLVVGFERSTWALRYTGNEVLPFAWERISRELGCESTYSMVPFDRGIISVGDKSINICTGTTVEPVDQDIPDEVFDFHNEADGPIRVHGIRNFITRQVYWNFSDADLVRKFPNRILVYNYENGAWATFTESLTVFGINQPAKYRTWAGSAGITWEKAEFEWGEGLDQSLLPQVIGGNQQGFTFTLMQTTADSPSLAVTATDSGAGTITIPNHNLEDTDVIKITGMLGAGSSLNGGIFQVIRADDNSVFLFKYQASTNTFIPVTIPAGTYLGLGVVQKLYNFSIRSKKFNILPQGTRRHLGYIDFLMTTTSAGQLSCLIYQNYADTIPINSNGVGVTNDDTFFNSVIETSPNQFDNSVPDKAWHRFYCPVNASFVQYQLTLSDAQANDEKINASEVEVDAVVLYSSAGGRLVD